MNYDEYGNEVNTEVDHCQNSDKKIDNQNVSKNNRIDSADYIFIIILVCFTIFLVYTRYIHSDDPECLVCGLFILSLFIVPVIFLVFLAVVIVDYIKMKKPILLVLFFVHIFTFLLYLFVGFHLWDFF